ncbi:hypothetical protein G419_21659 [Rhodococcus triatomae BKS 15-14]|nr:hypothetical protein G419_21659 [Rhodococcus triatomae BKS 15-14]
MSSATRHDSGLLPRRPPTDNGCHLIITDEGLSGMDRFELPQTLRRSSKEVQEVYATAHESAVKRFGAGEEAERAAYGAVKESYELAVDHWVPKQD